MKPIYVTQPVLPPLTDYTALLEEIWSSRILTNMGPLHERFAAALRELLGVAGLTLFVNGHTALEAGLEALDLTGEVITTPFTFASTTHALVRRGLTPVFADIRDDFTIDPEQVAALISEKTSAILPVHVYGHVCAVEALAEISRKSHLKLIYDGAHAFNISYFGKNIAAYGDMTLLSFHATKLFHTIEGGALVYSDPAHAELLDLLKNFGIQSAESVCAVGGNGKFSELAAAMGLCNLTAIAQEIDARRLATLRYREQLDDTPNLILKQPPEPAGSQLRHNFAYLPILLANQTLRDQVHEALRQQNIHARKYFFPLTSQYDCYRDRQWRGQTPLAADYANRVLTLPLYGALAQEDIDRICRIVDAACRTHESRRLR